VCSSDLISGEGQVGRVATGAGAALAGGNVPLRPEYMESIDPSLTLGVLWDRFHTRMPGPVIRHRHES
jgi:hypothetical protein